MSKHNQSRRKFLQNASQLSVAGVAAPFALNLASMGTAAAQSASDYKAIVCVFLQGAMDHNNTIVPFDQENHNIYKSARPGLAMDKASLIEIAPKTGLTGKNVGRQFGLAPQLAALKPIWDSEQLAVLANVGTLMVPTTKAQFKSGTVPLPANLFSHFSQMDTVQACNGETKVNGWAGRLADMFRDLNANPVFTANSVGGNAVWLNGQTSAGYQLGTSGSVKISAISGNLFGSTATPNALKTLIAGGGTHVFTQDFVKIIDRSINADQTLSNALNSAPALTTSGGSLSAQLRLVAQMIAVQSTLGAKRQVFFVRLGGFDTHSSQKNDLAELHTELAGALSYFNTTMNSLNMGNKVTTFTASDFGRTLVQNGDGCDHGWGTHSFLMGGAVKGKQFYGTFPTMGLNNDDEVGSGRLLPSTSHDQLAATLAKWFGVTSASDMTMILPRLSYYSNTDLGFMS
jgi:uncharacterized protein (DUF1501 family)